MDLQVNKSKVYGGSERGEKRERRWVRQFKNGGRGKSRTGVIPRKVSNFTVLLFFFFFSLSFSLVKCFNPNLPVQ